VYDPNILSPIKQAGKWAKEGEFLPSNDAGQSTMFMPTISTSTVTGTINVSTSIVATNYGVDGTGTIAFIEFKVIGEGKGVVSFYNVVYTNHLGMQTNISDKRGGTVTTIAEYVVLPDYGNVIAYPNPCQVYLGQQVHFKGLTPHATIKIFNIAGELVKEIEHNKDTDEEVWTNPGEVASGMYIYLIMNDKEQKATGRIGIVK